MLTMLYLAVFSKTIPRAIPFLDPCQHIMGFSLAQPPSQHQGNSINGFHVIVLTNKQHRKHNRPSGGQEQNSGAVRLVRTLTVGVCVHFISIHLTSLAFLSWLLNVCFRFSPLHILTTSSPTVSLVCLLSVYAFVASGRDRQPPASHLCLTFPSTHHNLPWPINSSSPPEVAAPDSSTDRLCLLRLLCSGPRSSTSSEFRLSPGLP